MITIRLAKKEWGKAWRAMVAVGPVTLIAEDPIYLVLPAHLDLLNQQGLSYEIVNGDAQERPREKHRRARSG